MRDDPTCVILWPVFLFFAALGAALLAADLAFNETTNPGSERLLGPFVGDLKLLLTEK